MNRRKTMTMGCSASAIAVASLAMLFLIPPAYAQDSSKWVKGSNLSGDQWIKQYKPPKAVQKKPKQRVSSGKGSIIKITKGLLPGILPPGVGTSKITRHDPPKPDRLLGKAKWGVGAIPGVQFQDWNLEPNDINQLMDSLQRSDLALKFLPQNVDLADFDFNPKSIKGLVFNGVRQIRLDSKMVERLRRYVLDGGFIIFDNLGGNEWFDKGARALGQQIMPESQWNRLPPDHPIYHMLNDVEKATFMQNAPGEQAVHEAIYVGSRAAIIYSPYGMSPGWAGHKIPIKEAVFYTEATARQLGINICAYMVGYWEAARVEAKVENYGSADEANPTDELVFAQVKHEGVWNVHPNAARNLLLNLRRKTAVRTNLKRVAISLEKDKLADYPFLYMTGLADFRFTDKEVTALRNFVSNGGVFFINNGLGLAEFHQTVNRELKRVFPNTVLKRIPPSHDIFHSVPQLSARKVKYSPELMITKPELKGLPYMEGMEINKRLAVIYSPYDIEGGWLDVDFPLFRGYLPDSSMRLGVNIVTYLMTH